MAVEIGNMHSKLGFGLMRLPRKGLGIDIEQTKEMVDLFLQAGGTYFDTAYIYPGSEVATRKALVERYPRDAYTLATKLNTMTALTENMAKKELTTSLERTGAGYFDYYLLHALSRSNVDKYERFHLWDFVQEEKAKGRIRHIGFSFHDSPELAGDAVRDVRDPVEGLAEIVEAVQLNPRHMQAPRSGIRTRRRSAGPLLRSRPGLSVLWLPWTAFLRFCPGCRIQHRCGIIYRT